MEVRNAMASIELHTIKGSWKANVQGHSIIEGVTFPIQNGKPILVWPPHKSEAKVLPMPKWADRAKK